MTGRLPSPDRYRASWAGIVTVSAGCLTLPVATISITRGTDAGLLAAACCYSFGAVALALVRLGELTAAAARHRAARHRAGVDHIDAGQVATQALDTLAERLPDRRPR